jgi:eukaryotic-like serine/threonine-protein kinase
LTLSPGSVLADRYRLTHPLGEGGMGEVWAATHVVTGRPVALKRLLHSVDSHPDGQGRARFVLEAQTACAVQHPNVVEILDFVESTNEPPVIVMELLKGETLASKLAREQQLSLQDTLRVLLPVVSAVGTAHSRGIIHRDLKPANIFLSRGGEADAVVKVLDFGIAKWLAPRPLGSGLRTQTGSTLGTPCYMAPEQAIGERMVDHKVDVWSLGVIFYECLSGSRPIEGENAAHMVARLLSTGIIPLARLVPSLPREVAELVDRMLAREPARRPRDLRDVCSVLAPLARISVPAFGEPHVDRTSDTVSSERLDPGSAPPVSWGYKGPKPSRDSHRLLGVDGSNGGWRSPRPRGRWGFAIAGVAAAAVALAAARWLPGRTSAPSPTPEVRSSMPLSAPMKTQAAPSERLTAEPAPSAAVPHPEAIAAAPLLAASHGPAQAPSIVVVSGSKAERAKARPPVPSSETRPGAPVPSEVPSLPKGAPCERSRECASGLCVAFTCE